MKIELIIIIILLLIIIFAIKRLFTFCKKYEYARILKNIFISEIYDSLKTGDIIFFRANSLSMPCAFFTHSYFTHIGIVIKDEFKNFNSYVNIYINETNPEGTEYLPLNYNKNWYQLDPNVKKKKKGWTLLNGNKLNPLLVRIKYFPGDCYLMKLNKELDNKRKSLLLKYSSKKIAYPITPMGAVNAFLKKDNLHCFQYIAYLLDKINITNIAKLYGISSICGEFGKLFNKKLNDGYIYEIPKRIIYDI